jgi:hypothetical protein
MIYGKVKNRKWLPHGAYSSEHPITRNPFATLSAIRSTTDPDKGLILLL